MDKCDRAAMSEYFYVTQFSSTVPWLADERKMTAMNCSWFPLALHFRPEYFNDGVHGSSFPIEHLFVSLLLLIEEKLFVRLHNIGLHHSPVPNWSGLVLVVTRNGVVHILIIDSSDYAKVIGYTWSWNWKVINVSLHQHFIHLNDRQAEVASRSIEVKWRSRSLIDWSGRGHLHCTVQSIFKNRSIHGNVAEK